MDVLIGIDAGKTNLRVGVFRQDLTLLAAWSIAATPVPEALDALTRQLLHFLREYTVMATGLSLFGPLEADPCEPDYGAITESSDPAWSHMHLPALVHACTRLPVFFDFDVNAGALAEATLGADQSLDSFVYLSIGTGVGGAVFQDGLSHGHAPQLGHMFLPVEPEDRDFAGACRFHGTCLQGLVSGRALAQRWGTPAEDLPDGHACWDLASRYLARAAANLLYTFAPQRIILGSSVGCRPGLPASVNAHLQRMLNGFLEPQLQRLFLSKPPVISAALANGSALAGAALLAKEQLGLVYRHPATRPS